MIESGKVVILITTPTEAEARSLADRLVKERMAACVNIVPMVNSLFWWQGKLDSAQESLLIIKSRASLLPKIIEMVKKAHRYQVPEVIALPIIGGNEDYLNWIDSEVGER